MDRTRLSVVAVLAPCVIQPNWWSRWQTPGVFPEGIYDDAPTIFPSPVVTPDELNATWSHVWQPEGGVALCSSEMERAGDQAGEEATGRPADVSEVQQPLQQLVDPFWPTNNSQGKERSQDVFHAAQAEAMPPPGLTPVEVIAIGSQVWKTGGVELPENQTEEHSTGLPPADQFEAPIPLIDLTEPQPNEAQHPFVEFCSCVGGFPQHSSFAAPCSCPPVEYTGRSECIVIQDNTPCSPVLVAELDAHPSNCDPEETATSPAQDVVAEESAPARTEKPCLWKKIVTVIGAVGAVPIIFQNLALN